MSTEPRLDDMLIGEPISRFLEAFCKREVQFSQIRFAIYKPEPKLSERLHNALTEEEKRLRDSATQICHDNAIPFWDALLGISMTKDNFPERFLDVAFSHTGELPAKSFCLRREEVSVESVASMTRELPDGCGLAVSSRVLGEGQHKIFHIPMLDFRCPTSAANVGAILRMLRLLGHEHGVLAESGRSYHYYGVKLLSPSEWQEFMARALLFAPITDPRYIAHRLIDGECRLKVVDSKEGMMPRISNVF